MKVQRIDNIGFSSNGHYMKEFGGKLSDGTTAIVRMHLNEAENLYAMEYYALNNRGGIVKGKGIGRKPKLKLVEITRFLNDIRKKTTDDWDVFEKFNDTIIK